MKKISIEEFEKRSKEFCKNYSNLVKEFQVSSDEFEKCCIELEKGLKKYYEKRRKTEHYTSFN